MAEATQVHIHIIVDHLLEDLLQAEVDLVEFIALIFQAIFHHLDIGLGTSEIIHIQVEYHIQCIATEEQFANLIQCLHIHLNLCLIVLFIIIEDMELI